MLKHKIGSVYIPLGIPHPLGGPPADQVSVRAGELEQAVIDTLTTY